MTGFTRRRIGLMAAAAAATALVAPAVARAQSSRNMSSFTMQRWQDHFDQLGAGAIVCDTRSRALHFWSGDGQTYRSFPTSVPISDELTKRGLTEITRKTEGPSWTPTASMMERFPHYRPMGPGPDNPLGTHAMYLSWPAYLIHGTHDTRKIGRLSSDGCIGLYNESIAELFAMTPVGTQVRII
ncbi:MAG: L,D-transpeptidase [Paracoccus sp. (in: a-proteobacteria)]